MDIKILAPGLISIFLLFSCKENKNDKAQTGPPPPVGVDILVAEKTAFSQSVEANGSALANESLELHPEVGGRLVLLNVPDGGMVKAGTVLAKINDQDLQAQLAKARVQLALAEKTEERQRKLLAINAINQSDYDLALSNLDAVKADIQLLNAQIEKTIIKAPFNGVLGLRNISPGSYVTPSTVIATLQQTEKIKIDFTIPESYVGYIKKGGKVYFSTVDTLRHTAIIEALEPQVDLSTRNIKVRAFASSNDVMPGAFVKVYVDVSSKSGSIKVPTNAIIPDATSNKLVVMKNGKGEFAKVATGYRTPYGVEITDGIEVGDSIVVMGVLFVKKGADLKVKSVKKLKELIEN
jgi:membrane fusion protein (multidrug efflux system)